MIGLVEDLKIKTIYTIDRGGEGYILGQVKDFKIDTVDTMDTNDRG